MRRGQPDADAGAGRWRAAGGLPGGLLGLVLHLALAHLPAICTSLKPAGWAMICCHAMVSGHGLGTCRGAMTGMFLQLSTPPLALTASAVVTQPRRVVTARSAPTSLNCLHRRPSRYCAAETGNAAANPPQAVLDAGLPWPATVRTNIFDTSWQYNMRCAVQAWRGVSERQMGTTACGQAVAVR